MPYNGYSAKIGKLTIYEDKPMIIFFSFFFTKTCYGYYKRLVMKIHTIYVCVCMRACVCICVCLCFEKKTINKKNKKKYLS